MSAHLSDADLAPLEITPDPVAERALLERRELMRLCAQRTVDMANRGLSVDPIYLAQCEAMVANTPRLRGPLGTGEPESGAKHV